MRIVPALALLTSLTAAQNPRVLDRTAPEYTDEARLARLEGSDLVTLLVDQDATLRDVHITRPIGLGLDQNAINAVKDWQFAPATEGEKSIAAVARVEVNFRLLIGRDDWHMERADFDTPAGASRPVVTSVEYPETGKGPGGTARVSFIVNEKGAPVDIQVDRSSDPKSADDVVRFLSAWRFRPGMQNGRAVAVHATFDFARGAVTPSE